MQIEITENEENRQRYDQEQSPKFKEEYGHTENIMSDIRGGFKDPMLLNTPLEKWFYRCF
jgi:hypothetical protein